MNVINSKIERTDLPISNNGSHFIYIFVHYSLNTFTLSYSQRDFRVQICSTRQEV